MAFPSPTSSDSIYRAAAGTFEGYTQLQRGKDRNQQVLPLTEHVPQYGFCQCATKVNPGLEIPLPQTWQLAPPVL